MILYVRSSEHTENNAILFSLQTLARISNLHHLTLVFIFVLFFTIIIILIKVRAERMVAIFHQQTQQVRAYLNFWKLHWLSPLNYVLFL